MKKEIINELIGKDFEYREYNMGKGRKIHIIITRCVDTLKKLKDKYNRNGYVVTKVYIKGDNEEFKMYVKKGSIYIDGRTRYIKNNRYIPYYLTGI